MKLLFSIFIFYLICFKNVINANLWDSNNYPNPITDYQKFGMNISSQICDPDSVFSPGDRLAIFNKLKWLETATAKNDKNDCSGKGLFAMTIVGNNFQGGSSDSLKAIANEMISKWSSTSTCKKLIIIAFAAKDRKVWITADSGVSIECKKYTEIFEAQKSLFQSGDYTSAFLNIIDALKSANEEKKSKGGLSVGAIIGIVLGSIAIVMFCCACIKGEIGKKGSSSSSGDGGYTGGGGGDCGGGGDGGCDGGGGDF